MMVPRDKKAYMTIYMKQPEVMSKNRANSVNRLLEKKQKNVKKRIQEHTMYELMKIIKERCAEKNVDFEEKS
jgi:hypothetical protein